MTDALSNAPEQSTRDNTGTGAEEEEGEERERRGT
jgi:hypothetical protein